jgi:hypothetical protein
MEQISRWNYIGIIAYEKEERRMNLIPLRNLS